MRLCREGAMRGGVAWFPFQSSQRGLRSRARCGARRPLSLARPIGLCRGFAGLSTDTARRWLQRYARAPRFRQADRDRLFCGLGSMLAFADVMHFLTHELAGRRGWRSMMSELVLRA